MNRPSASNSLPPSKWRGNCFIPSMSCVLPVVKVNSTGIPSEEIHPFGGTFTSVFFSFDDTGVRDTDMMTDGCRKTVDAVNGLNVQLFYGLSCVKEQPGKKFSDLMKSSIETTFAKHTGHQVCRVDKTERFFNANRRMLTRTTPCPKLSVHKSARNMQGFMDEKVRFITRIREDMMYVSAWKEHRFGRSYVCNRQ